MLVRYIRVVCHTFHCNFARVAKYFLLYHYKGFFISGFHCNSKFLSFDVSVVYKF